MKWFMDNILLNELPQCDPIGKGLCDVDPSKLILESVSGHFSGNFSCVGSSPAGNSPMSDPLFLDVHYPPGEAQLTSSPEPLYKEGNLVLNCILPEPGHPPASQFRWLQGGAKAFDKTSQTWT